jgi:steroid delta-isomerase-like uncharacterized protein
MHHDAVSRHKAQVRKFYELLWDAHDAEAMPSILHQDFTFRGSLGEEKRGHRGFAEYVDRVHAALGDYRCSIEALVAEDDRVFAKMTFAGRHRAEFMGYAATRRRVSWQGCALFTFVGERIADVWVLGDLKGLEAQLEHHRKVGPDRHPEPG